MSNRQIKAYSLFASKEYVEKTYDEPTRQQILSSLSPGAKAVLDNPKKASVVPPEYATEIWRGIVEAHKDDPAEAVNRLRACGRYSGEYATNTYLKLLFRILSVKMFATKLPQIWSRDSSFGKITAEMDQIKNGKLGLHFSEMDNYPYFGPNCEGWFYFTFETMGLKNVKIELRNWSLEKPDPGNLDYHVTWTP